MNDVYSKGHVRAYMHFYALPDGYLSNTYTQREREREREIEREREYKVTRDCSHACQHEFRASIFTPVVVKLSVL
jgi:hypothetical protein